MKQAIPTMNVRCVASLACVVLGVFSSSYARAQPGDPKDPNAPVLAETTGAMIRALTDARLGNNPAALTTLEELAEDQPYASVYALMSEVYASMDRSVDARHAMEQAVAASPGASSYAIALGDLQQEAGMTTEAEATYRSVLEQDESDARALTALARLEVEQGNIDEALRFIERANAATPTLASLKLADDLKSSRNEADDREANPGNTVSDQETHDENRTSAEEALGFLEEHSRDLSAWRNALDVLTTHLHPRAAATAEDALLLFPGRPELLIPAAEILVANERETEALAAVAPLLDGPTIPDPELRARGWGTLAIAHANRGEIGEASLAQKHVEDILPGSVFALHAKGHIELARGNEGAALDAWNQALALQPDHEVIASHLNE